MKFQKIDTNFVMQLTSITVTTIIIVMLCFRAIPESMRTGTEQLPFFRFDDGIQTKEICTYEIKNDKPLLIVFFSPECDYCHQQIERMADSIEFLMPFRMLFLAAPKYEAQKIVRLIPDRLKTKNTIIGIDVDDTYTKVFKATTYPYTIMYDSNRQFMSMHMGIAKLSSLVKIYNRTKKIKYH
ncbi:MAG: hypothetical protein DI539_22675 [Flavobacterium psychrophilum]|nr:MAG: hypothetical protein DI539_22675 [Flavobacterium psychrophilum]